MDGLVGLLGKGHPSEPASQQAHPDPVEISGRGRILPRQDLGGGVGDAGGDGVRGGIGPVVQAGNAEIAEYGFAPRPDEHVLRFEVAVEDAGGVGDGQSIGQLGPEHLDLLLADGPLL